MNAPIERPVRFECPGVLTWARRQPCAFCMKAGPSEPHHYPTRGAGGDEWGVIPLCREHHDQAQRYEGALDHSWQHIQALVALKLFLKTANDHEFASFVSSRERWLRARIFVEW